MTEPTQTVFDAVSAAIDDATPGASHVAPTPSESDDVLDSASDPAADAEDELEGDDLGDESEPPPEEGAEPKIGDGKDAPADKTVDEKPGEPDGKKPGDERNPDGTPKEPAKVEPVKKAPDAINDPIPKELARETQDRIRTLIKTTKETEAKATEATKQLDYIVDGVRATNMSPQQYGEVLSFMQLFNSGDPAQQGKALELVENIADRLASLLGKERTVSDPLKGHADLIAAVAQGQMTRQWAGQMASARRQQTTRSEIETTARTTQDSQNAYVQEKETARVDMNKWEIETAAKDPQFKLLAPKIVKEMQKD